MASLLFTISGAMANALAFGGSTFFSSVGSRIMVKKNAKDRLQRARVNGIRIE